MVYCQRKKVLSTLLLSLLVLFANLMNTHLAVAQAMPRPQAAGAPVLVVSHEADLSEYSRVISNSGKLSQSAAAALGGTSGGLAVQIKDAEPLYGQVDFGPLTNSKYRFRFYFDPNGLAMSSESFQNIAGLYANKSQRAWVTMRYRSGKYQVQMNVSDDAEQVYSADWYTVADEEHYAEVLVEYASSPTASNGRVTLWIDGNQQTPVDGIDLYDLSKPDQLRFGSVWGIQAQTTGTYYLDEFVLRNDATQIGPFESRTPSAIIRHENGLTEYDRVVDGDQDLAQSQAAALGGTQGGLQVTIDDTNAAYGTQPFSVPSGSAYRFRHYVDPNGLSMPNPAQISLATLLRGGQNRIVTRLQNTSSGFKLYVRYIDDNDEWHSMTAAPIDDAQHYIEVLVEFASDPSAKNGRVTYWVDGVQADQDTGLDIHDLPRRPDQMRLGTLWVSEAAIKGTIYLDEFVLYNDGQYIGPVSSQPAPAPTQLPTNTPIPTATPIPPTATPTLVPPTATPTNTATPVPPTATVTVPNAVDIHHLKDLSEYDEVLAGSGNLRQDSLAALAGTEGGMQIAIDSTNAFYGTKEFAPPAGTAYRFRHYLDPNGIIMPNSGQVTLAQLRRSGNSIVTRLQYTDAGGYRLYVRFIDDNGEWRSTAVTPIDDAEHYIEVLVEFASSASAQDGRVTYWVDGIQRAQVSRLDLYDQQRRPDHLRFGAVWVSQADTQGTLFLDEFAFRNGADPIGPVGNNEAPTATPVPETATPTATATLVPPTATPTNTATPVPPTATPTNTATPVPPAATVTVPDAVDIHHQKDLSEYDDVLAGSGNLRQDSLAALAGTEGGMQIALDGTNAFYGTKEFAPPAGTAYRFRHYFDPNGISMPNNGQITLAQLRRSGNSIVTRLQHTDAGGYRLYVRFIDDNGEWRSTAATSITDAEHHIEVLVEFASSASAQDGRVTYWVDGIQRVPPASGLDLYDQHRRPDHLRFGAVWVSQADTQGTLFLDEFAFRNGADPIGPVGNNEAPTTTPVPETATPTATATLVSPTATPTNTTTPVPPTATPTNTATPVPATATPTNTPTPTEPQPPAEVNQWHRLDTSGGGGQGALAFHPTNPNIAYTVGDNSGAYKTEDAGAHWVSISSNLGVNRLTDIEVDPLNPNIVYITAATGWSSPTDAGNTGEIHRSMNGGASWNYLSDKMGFKTFVASHSIVIPYDPANPNRFDQDRDRISDVLILGAWIGPDDAPIGGIWRSEDEGQTFTQVALNARNITALYSFQADPKYMFLSTYDGAIYSSSDLGKTWQEITGNLPMEHIDDLAIHPTNRSTLYVTGQPNYTTRSPVWKTTNGGATWHEASTGLNTKTILRFPRVIIDRFNSDKLYVSTHNAPSDTGGVYTSANGGETWQRMPSQLVLPDGRPYLWYQFDQVFALGQAINGRLFACTWSGVFRYPGGAQANENIWEPIPIGIGNIHVNTIAVAPSSDQELYQGISDFGPYKSADRGESFHRILGNGWPVTPSNYVWNGPYYSNYEKCSLKCSSSCTESGRLAAGGTTDFVVSYQNPNVVYSSFGSGSNRNAHGGINKSTDGGRTWKPVGFQTDYGLYLDPESCVPSGVRHLAIDPTNDQIVFAAQEAVISQGLLYRTTNGGKTWTLVYSTPYQNIQKIVVSPRNPNVVVMVTTGAVYRSTQGGAHGTWTRLAISEWSGIGSVLIGTIAISPHDENVYAIGTVTQGLWYSDDAGKSWINTNLTGFFEQYTSMKDTRPLDPSIATANNPTAYVKKDISAIVFDPVKPDTIYAAGSQRPRSSFGVLKITAAGTRWERLALEGFSHRNVFDLDVDSLGAYLYAATNDGTFRFKLN